MRQTVKLDEDEREVINCLIEKVLQKDKILKYIRGHGVDLRDLGNRPFEYDKETGIVTYDDGK